MQRIVIVSTCSEDWGGSEELWGRSVPYFQQAGYNLSVVKYNLNKNHPEFLKLAQTGVDFFEIFPRGTVSQRVIRIAYKTIDKAAKRLKLRKETGEDFSPFVKIIKNLSPTLVIISQGINFDGLKLAYQCLLLKTPYIIISQKAVDFYWPSKEDRAPMLAALLKSRQTFFVSHHNKRLTEEQFGKRLANSQVIFNPVKLSGAIVPYPAIGGTYKLACLGRLFVLDKGQDIILRIMSKPKWKDRPFVISFIGKGVDEQGLKDMAALLQVKNVEFLGQIDDIEQMWREYHALILPSRSEGLPLSMVEAMAAGRPVIISNAGGNTELVEEGVTGFIGFPNEESFEEAMENAWNNRDNWEQIGKNAAAYILNNVPSNPEKDFAKKVLDLL
jgi:glycosyltransferase involved in cell wall biosynthesis